MGGSNGCIVFAYCIHTNVQYNILQSYICTVYAILLCICTYCKYTVGAVVETTSTQTPPVLSDNSWTFHYVNSSTVNHLCIKTTCLESPPFTGALGGLYIQVPLYINYFNVSFGWSLYTGSTVRQQLQCVPWVVFICRFHCICTVCIVVLLIWVVFCSRIKIHFPNNKFVQPCMRL